MDQDHPDHREIEEGKDLLDRGVNQVLTEDQALEDLQDHEDPMDLQGHLDQLELEVSAILSI